MKKALFKRELKKAMAAADRSPEYWLGYQQGLRRRQEGEGYGFPGEHEKWLALDDECGQGYRDGYRGPVDWDKPHEAVRIIREWRGWTRDEMGLQFGRAGRSIEGWEQGRRQVSAVALARLRMVYEEL